MQSEAGRVQWRGRSFRGCEEEALGRGGARGRDSRGGEVRRGDWKGQKLGDGDEVTGPVLTVEA